MHNWTIIYNNKKVLIDFDLLKPFCINYIHKNIKTLGTLSPENWDFTLKYDIIQKGMFDISLEEMVVFGADFYREKIPVSDFFAHTRKEKIKNFLSSEC